MAKVAYCSGEAVYSEYDREWKYPHSDSSRVVYREVLLPPNAPKAYADSQTLWNAVDSVEPKSNSQTARHIYIAMPRELTFEQNKELIRNFCQKEFVDKGMIVDLYFHDDQRGNPHIHLLITIRAMDENGRWLSKSKTVPILDENGNKIRDRNGRCKRKTTQTVDWNDQKYGDIWCLEWGAMQNAALEKAGSNVRVDMRSLKRQGITDREPQVHMGPAASAMEKKGIRTEVGDLNREIQESNKAITNLKRVYTSLKIWFKELSDTIKNITTIEEPEEKSLVDVLLAYENLRKQERTSWNGYAQRSGNLKDLQEYSQVFIFMKQNDIRTVNDLGVLLNDSGMHPNDLNNVVKRNTRRIRDIQALLDAVKTVQMLTPIEEELKTKHFGRQKFIDEHKDDLDRLAKMRYLVNKLSQGESIDRKTLLAESQKLQDEIESLQPEIEHSKSELDQLKRIRSMVRKVIPDALPSKKKGEPASLAEQLEAERNRAELKKISDRVANHVLSMNPENQVSALTDHQTEKEFRQGGG